MSNHYSFNFLKNRIDGFDDHLSDDASVDLDFVRDHLEGVFDALLSRDNEGLFSSLEEIASSLDVSFPAEDLESVLFLDVSPSRCF